MTAENAEAGNIPSMEVSIPEFRNLQKVLEEQGVEVLTPDALGKESKVFNQSYSRDIGFVIGDKFFVSRMKKESRMQEWRSIAKFVAAIPEANRVYVPEGMFIEGGDIVVDKGNVFVGISQRTTEEALAFLEVQLAGTGLKVVPVRTRSIEEGKDVLHLDCTFVPVGRDSALIYMDGISDIPTEISQNYDLIEVTAEEQRELATNVLALSPTQVIARDSAQRVNSEMTRRGIQVIPIQFNDAAMFGGSIRCCTLPLVRQS
jgi:N-dimethylarginine dimethylaminohydrolase